MSCRCKTIQVKLAQP